MDANTMKTQLIKGGMDAEAAERAASILTGTQTNPAREFVKQKHNLAEARRQFAPLTD